MRVKIPWRGVDGATAAPPPPPRRCCGGAAARRGHEVRSVAGAAPHDVRWQCRWRSAGARAGTGSRARPPDVVRSSSPSTCGAARQVAAKQSVKLRMKRWCTCCTARLQGQRLQGVAARAGGRAAQLWPRESAARAPAAQRGKLQRNKAFNCG